MEKEKFKQQAKQQIDNLFEKIEELENKREAAADEVQDTYNNQLKELKQKKEQLLKEYNELTDVAEDNWEQAKEAFSTTAQSVQDGFAKIAEAFKPQEADA